jgi:hypothetical protein
MSSLTLMSSEKIVMKRIDWNDIIIEFAAHKARK